MDVSERAHYGNICMLENEKNPSIWRVAAAGELLTKTSPVEPLLTVMTFSWHFTQQPSPLYSSAITGPITINKLL